MLKELGTVTLIHDISEHHLKKGDVGTIVYLYDQNNFEVEFVNKDGLTPATLTLQSTDIRLMTSEKVSEVPLDVQLTKAQTSQQNQKNLVA